MREKLAGFSYKGESWIVKAEWEAGGTSLWPAFKDLSLGDTIKQGA